MRLLVDAVLSPAVVALLRDSGIEATHVADVGLLNGSDNDIFDHAASHGFVVVTADTDFPMMLALRRATAPSVVLLRGVTELRPAVLAQLLLANLSSVTDRLEAGAIVSLSPASLRWRELPIS